MAHDQRNTERFESLVDVAAISTLSVILIGLGRVGMSFLRQIIQYPITQVILVDHDSVSAKELGSVFPLDCGGLPKVEAAKQFVKYWNKQIDVKILTLRIERATLDELLAFEQDANLLAWFADDLQALEHTVEATYEHLDTVSTIMSEQASYSETAWSSPGTKCVACALNAANRTTAHGAHNLPADVDAAVNVAVNCAVGLSLVGKMGYELFQHLLEPDHNLLITQNRNNAFSRTSNELVPRLTQLVRVDNGPCRVCRGYSG